MKNIIGGVALLSLAVPGFFINLIILGKNRFKESAALSWLSGSVIFTLIIYILNTLLHIKLGLTSSLLTLITITIISFLFAKRKLPLIKSVKLKKHKVLIISVFIFFVLVFITSFFFPVTDWDAITVFDFRAKIILANGLANRPF